MAARTRLGIRFAVLLALAAAFTPAEAFALITGGEGNQPIHDPGWPKGAAEIFNVASRIAWWEGPPFGGGQWHAECRGDAQALNMTLAAFAQLDVKSKRVVLHDGVGQSFWLNLNNEPDKRAKAKMDWSFTVWQPDNWERLRKLPADLNPIGPAGAESGPPAQLDIYTAGFKWAEVTVPKSLKVDDQRLEAHGFTAADGVVLEGTVTDLATNQPVAGTMSLELIEPQQKGGYRYSNAASATADAKGHWVLKKAPMGWYRVVIAADGYVPRVIGHLKTEDQPRWHSYDGGLARPAVVAGRLTDEAGQPLADVEVLIQDVTACTGARYESALGYSTKTGADGRFRADHVPVGRATIWVRKPGYVRPGLGEPITTPKEDVELTMIKSGRILVTVDFAGKERPEGYIVAIEPEGGEAIGKYGGSGNIDAKNQIAFENVPPGRYTLRGRPNPSSGDQETNPVTVELQGGKTMELKLNAK